MQPFLVCIHDATPAYARETELMLGDLAPLIGRRLSLGVVPNWHGQWPLTAYTEYCRLVSEHSDELLLHGYFHYRQRGSGPVSLLAECSDEMNGLDEEATRDLIERGQRDFNEVFRAPASGFLAPAWQPGHVCGAQAKLLGLKHVLGFFALESCTRRTVPLATFSWDCGRWGALGHLGHGVGWLLQHLDRRVPTLAIHPRDLQRGFWPQIRRLIQKLLDAGFEPGTPSGILEATNLDARDAEAAV